MKKRGIAIGLAVGIIGLNFGGSQKKRATGIQHNNTIVSNAASILTKELPGKYASTDEGNYKWWHINHWSMAQWIIASGTVGAMLSIPMAAHYFWEEEPIQQPANSIPKSTPSLDSLDDEIVQGHSILVGHNSSQQEEITLKPTAENHNQQYLPKQAAIPNLIQAANVQDNQAPVMHETNITVEKPDRLASQPPQLKNNQNNTDEKQTAIHEQLTQAYATQAQTYNAWLSELTHRVELYSINNGSSRAPFSTKMQKP